MRDYTDLMNMPPTELVRHALDCAKVGILSIALVEALALQLEAEAQRRHLIQKTRPDGRASLGRKP